MIKVILDVNVEELFHTICFSSYLLIQQSVADFKYQKNTNDVETKDIRWIKK